MALDLAVIVTARNEADRLGTTMRALRQALPGAEVWVADDASTDATAHVALQAGARLVRAPQRVGKGGAATMAARAVLAEGDPTVLLADADLGESAGALRALVDAVAAERTGGDAASPGGATSGGDAASPGGATTGGDAASPGDATSGGDAASPGGADLAIATFARRVGGGFGVAVGSARWAIERATGRTMQAPISGQRAMRPGVLSSLLPFARGFGMETGMTIDALRAGLKVVEVELDLEHRATGKTLRGFLHRGRQARDILQAYASRRA